MDLSFDTVSAPASYALVALLVGAESSGLPVPGELAMVAAAIYAATTGQLTLQGVILAGMAGAVLGGFCGYAAGRLLGPPLLVRYGPRLGLSLQRQKLGRYLFARHGGKIVAMGRFVSVARNFCCVLAGANAMPADRFAVWNLAGGVLWPMFHCSLAFAFGSHASEFSALTWVGLVVVIATALTLGLRALHRHEARLTALAEALDPS